MHSNSYNIGMAIIVSIFILVVGSCAILQVKQSHEIHLIKMKEEMNK